MTVVYHPEYLHHRQWFGHPENPARLEHCLAKLEKEGLMEDFLTPEEATGQQLQAAHLGAYIDTLDNFGTGYLDVNSYVHSDTSMYARLSAGGTVMAARVAHETGAPTLALNRPPGHHAGRDFGGGFCYFNNAAIAARSLQKAGSGKKFAIVDIDTHHGNGTEDITKASKDILYISTHERGIYPGTGFIDYCGEGEGEGFNVNIPFPSRCGDRSFARALEEVMLPVLGQFGPDMILVSLGVDAHYKDGISSLTLSSPGYLHLTGALIEAAGSLCGGKISFTLEGGYHLTSLAEVVAGVVASFEDKQVHLQFDEVHDIDERGFDTIDAVKDVQGVYWSL